MTRCYGESCILHKDCYRFTIPYHVRDAFAKIPYDSDTNSCNYFVSNIPTEDFIRTTAYYLWLQLGKPEGCSTQIWLQAQQLCYASYGRMQ